MASLGHFYRLSSPKTANLDDFFYFFYGVPILLAIAAPDDSNQDKLFFWFDGIQAAAVGFLAYLELFSVVPFSGAARHPMPVSRLILIYDVENLVLAIFATARMLVSPRSTAYRRFFQVLAAFLWTYGICAGIYNHIVANSFDAGLLDALVDVPLLLLVGLAVFPAELSVTHGQNQEQGPIAVFIDNARPTILGLALVLLGAVVGTQHVKVAMATILGAFVLYGARSAMLQTRLLNTQRLLETANTRLAEMTLEDGLTGVANRRSFDQRLSHEWSRARRSQTPLSLLLIDIDHFKRLNDTYGHIVGDECLIQVARLLRGVLHRPADLLARYGGEEFVALLPDTDEVGAQNLAFQMQAALRNSVPVSGIDCQVTVSIGVTTWLNHKRVTAQQFVNTADRALYAAKQNGRNRIEVLSLAGEQDTSILRQ
ncbi:MAG: diguanylate cyclase [Acidobacteriota bacterium]